MPIRARIVLLLACCLAAASGASAREAVTLAADAGLGGIAKPGRWTPVRVTIESASETVAGDLVVDWGSARVRRAVNLTAPSRWQVELYIRAADVREIIRVRLVSNGRDLAAADVPIRIARPDEPVTLCLGSAPGPAGPTCTVTVAPAALPHSWRGYDAANQVVWPDGDPSALAVDQRDALDAWRAIRPIDDAGNLTWPPRAPEPTGTPQRAGAAVLGAYAIALVGAGLVVRKRSGRVRARYGVMLGLVVAGSAITMATGRFGPASVIIVSHTTVVEEFAGTAKTLVSLRGLAEFPMFDAFALRSTISDAAIDRQPPSRLLVEQQFDEAGFPLLSGVFGLGARQAFSLTGMADLVLLRAARQGGTIRVSNASAFELGDCEVSSATAVSAEAIGTLHPGDHVDVIRPGDADDPQVSCTAPSSLITFADARHAVQSLGTVRLIFHLAPPPAPTIGRP
jgi:hypothetical protein